MYNKVFPIMQRKDKDVTTGQYVDTSFKPDQPSLSRKCKWLLFAICAILLVLIVMAVATH